MRSGDSVAEAVKLDELCPEETLAKLRERPLLQLCKDMQPFLTEEASLLPAMRVLAKASVKRDSPLRSEEIALLGGFFAQKAANPSYADVAATCFRALVEEVRRQAADRTTELFVLTVDELLPVIHLQDRAVGVRCTCFEVLHAVMREDVVSDPAVCTAERLRVVLDALDGEGDPKLVLATFSITHDILSWASPSVLERVAEVVFESLASYFPILFSQPPGCTVTKQELQSGLSRCLSQPALADFSVPFLLGKAASPSTVVKMDAVQTLQECVEGYPDALLFGAFASDIVAQLRNEVIKMSAFPNHGDGATLSRAVTPAKVVSLGCAVLRKVAERITQCGDPSTDDKVLQTFESVNEGALQALSSGTARHTCAAYATMLYNTVVGSWPVCVVSGGYVFTMVSVAAAEGGGGQDADTANALTLLSALCAGFVDALDAGPGDEEGHHNSNKTQLRAKLAKALPAFVNTVQATCEALRSPKRDSSGEHDGDTENTSPTAAAQHEILSLCQAEFLCTALRLDLRLSPWLSDAELEQMVTALLWAAVQGATASVRAGVGRRLCGFAAEDPENRAQQAVHLFLAEEQNRLAASLPESGAPAKGQDTEEANTRALTDLMEALSAASPAFARFALLEVLLPTAAAGTTAHLPQLRSVDRTCVVVSILESLRELDDATATSLLERLLAAPQDPAAFGSVRAILARASEELLRTLSSAGWGDDSALFQAALLSCRPNRVRSLESGAEACARFTTRFISVLDKHPFSGDDEEDDALGERNLWRSVAMNGITGAVVHASGSGGDVGGHALLLSRGKPKRDVALAVAVLWGLCIGGRGDGTRESTEGAGTDLLTSQRANEEGCSPSGSCVVADELVELLSTVVAGRVPQEAFSSSLHYFPALVTAMPPTVKRGSLLTPYLAVSMRAVAAEGECVPRPFHLPVYWQGLAALLSNEDLQHIDACEADLLRLLTSVKAADGGEIAALARSVVFLLERKGVAGCLYQAVLAHTEFLGLVCGGLTAPALTDRCATLTFLSSVAGVAAKEGAPAAHMPNPVRRKRFQDVRDTILAETLPVLSDKKRLVRQAAGRCRNQWYRVK